MKMYILITINDELDDNDIWLFEANEDELQTALEQSGLVNEGGSEAHLTNEEVLESVRDALVGAT